MKLMVAGSRSLSSDLVREALWSALDKALDAAPDLEVVHGGARGVDTLAQRWCEDRGVPSRVFAPEYERHGRAAPHVRNRQMLAQVDRVIAVWDGVSTGTESVLVAARSLKKPLTVLSPAGGVQ